MESILKTLEAINDELAKLPRYEQEETKEFLANEFQITKKMAEELLLKFKNHEQSLSIAFASIDKSGFKNDLKLELSEFEKLLKGHSQEHDTILIKQGLKNKPSDAPAPFQ